MTKYSTWRCLSLVSAWYVLSLSLQKSDCDIVYGLKQILKAADSIKSLRIQNPSLWPTVKLVLERIHTKGNVATYQGAEIKNYNSVTLKAAKGKLWLT